MKLNVGLPRRKVQQEDGSFTSKLDLNLRQRSLCGAETWTVGKVGQMYLERCEMWCWRKISWTDRGWNEEVLQETNILQTVKRRKAA